MLVNKEQLKNLPDKPGIYLFFNAEDELIYVGKASSLKQRVRSYFSGKKTPRPIEEMIHEVKTFKVIETNSALEAAILEADRITRYQPKYNVLGKDNKSWNYIAFTTDEYPRIVTIREHELNQKTEAEKQSLFRSIFGPFPGINMKVTLKILRKLFTFSTCSPTDTRPCFYYQMGQCLGVCTGEITKEEYIEQVIEPLELFLSGKTHDVLDMLKERMSIFAQEEAFEQAARLRNQIERLTHIHDMALLNTSFVQDTFIEGLDQFSRIEGYDISHFGGSNAVGSMVVFEQGVPNKKEYKSFNIKFTEGSSDIDSLIEVLTRRMNHIEWLYPDLILIDGGAPQVSAIQSLFSTMNLDIPIIGIAKGPERKKNEFLFGKKDKEVILWVDQHKDILIKVRDEAHRFALVRQKRRRKIQ